MLPAAPCHNDSWEAERLDRPSKPTLGPQRLRAAQQPLQREPLPAAPPLLSHVTAFIFTSVKHQPLRLGKQQGLSPGGERRLCRSWGLRRGHSTVAIERTHLKIRASDFKKTGVTSSDYKTVLGSMVWAAVSSTLQPSSTASSC